MEKIQILIDILILFLGWIQAYHLFIQKIYYNLFFEQHMKFLLAAALFSTAYSQEILTSDGEVIRPPIQIYEEETKTKTETETEKIQIKSDSQPFIPSTDQIKQSIDFIDIAQIIKKVIEDQQPVKQSVENDESIIQPEYIVQPVMPPVPIQKFQETKQEPILIIDPIPQPIPFIQPQNSQETNIKHKKDGKHKKHHKSTQKYESIDPFITQPDYDRKKQKFDKKKKHLRKDKRKSHQKWEREEFIGENQYQYQKFEKQYQNGKHNKNMCFAFFLVALISTIFGLILGKCVRKCKKNKGKKVIYVSQERTVSQIQQQIVEKQRIINELKEQYRNKRAAEDSLTQIKRQEEAVSRAYEAQMRQIKQRRQQNYNQPPQRYMTVQNEHIPMGRPIISSKNSSFACEYPQL